MRYGIVHVTVGCKKKVVHGVTVVCKKKDELKCKYGDIKILVNNKI